MTTGKGMDFGPLVGSLIAGLAPLLAATVPAKEATPRSQERSQTAVIEGPARVDRDGEPLPARAIRRMGSLSFRAEGPITAVSFSADGKTLVSVLVGGAVCRWSSATGKLLHRL